jgi:hypothetical protein
MNDNNNNDNNNNDNNNNKVVEDIISTSKNTVLKIYYYLESILVFKEHEINENADLITQTQQFILRYRRLIGLVLLIVLIYIWFNCDVSNNKNNKDNNKVQSGGSADAFEAAERAKYEAKKKKAEFKQQFQKEDAKKEVADLKAKAEKEVADLKAIKDKRKEDKASRSVGQKTKDVFYSKAGTELQREKLKDAYKDSAVGKKMDEMKSMREAGFSTKAIIGKNVYQAGAYVGEKFKEFAGWLYEILFAIAISIAICMVVLPSVSFFILALICFFLLKKKVSSVKGL